MNNFSQAKAVQSFACPHIARLNDVLRQTGEGGQVVITPGIAALPRDQREAILAAVAAFDRFTPDNDPQGAHDLGTLRVAAHQVVFEISHFDVDRGMRSPSASDAGACRTLTIMLAAER